MKIGELKEFDAADVLTDDESILHYLKLAFEEGDPHAIQQALWTVARVLGVSRVSKDAGLSDDGLRAALSCDGSLDFATLLIIVRALGFKLIVTPSS